ASPPRRHTGTLLEKEGHSQTISIRARFPSNNPAIALTLACARFVQRSACLTPEGAALCSQARERCDPGGSKHARNKESGAGRPDRRVLRLRERGGARDQADARRPELSDRLGALPRAAALGQASRRGDQGSREDRGLSVADPGQGRGYVEGHPRRHCGYRLVRAGLLARADATLRRHVASLSADQFGGEGKRSAVETLREVSLWEEGRERDSG